MTRRFTYRCALAGLALLAAPAGMQAQDKLTISLRGATSETPVSTVIGGKRELVGLIDRNGSGVLNLRRANIGKGERVNVKVDTRDGREQVVLVSGRDPECEDTERRNEEGCQPIGAFPWGGTGAIEIIKTPTGWSFGSQPGGVLNVSTSRGRWSVGGIFGLTWLPRLLDVAGNQPGLTSITGDNTSVSVGAIVAYRPWERVVINLIADYSTQSYQQTYDPQQGPTAASGEIRALFVDLSAYFVVNPGSRLQLGFGGGPTLARDELDLSVFSGPGSIERESRSFTALKSNLGLMVGGSLGNGFNLGLDVMTRTAFQGGDADWTIASRFQLTKSL